MAVRISASNCHNSVSYTHHRPLLTTSHSLNPHLTSFLISSRRRTSSSNHLRLFARVYVSFRRACNHNKQPQDLLAHRHPSLSSLAPGGLPVNQAGSWADFFDGLAPTFSTPVFFAVGLLLRNPSTSIPDTHRLPFQPT